MKTALELLTKLTQAKVLCVGDIMVDSYIYGQATRISPEAPVPVVRVKKHLTMPGGVGNVAKNIGAIKAAPVIISVIGADHNAQILKNLLQDSNATARFITDPSRPTSVKTRIIAGIQQVVRFDEEEDSPLTGLAAEQLIEAIKIELPQAGSVALSDYGKGTLADNILREIIFMARAAGKPVIVDPKGSNYRRYRGATLVTPNRAELTEAVGRKLETESDLEKAGREVMAECGLANLLVTRSEDGMMLLESEGQTRPAILPSQARQVFDVSGAGDTVVAVMAAALSIGAPLVTGALLANLAAGVVVGKVGTATASPEEITAWSAQPAS